MKGILLDENLPTRLRFTPSLRVVHFSKAGKNPNDTQIWEFAKQNELVIVSKDADFSERIIMQTPPPLWCICASAICGETTSMPG